MYLKQDKTDDEKESLKISKRQQYSMEPMTKDLYKFS